MTVAFAGQHVSSRFILAGIGISVVDVMLRKPVVGHTPWAIEVVILVRYPGGLGTALPDFVAQLLRRWWGLWRGLWSRLWSIVRKIAGLNVAAAWWLYRHLFPRVLAADSLTGWNVSRSPVSHFN